ncbi:hypothetical protein FOZ62_028009, partial [Perkinsus olseni]
SVVAASVSLVIPRRRAAVESIFADWRLLRRTTAFAREVDCLQSLIDAGVRAKALRRWRGWRKQQTVERWNSTWPRRAGFDCLHAWRRWYKRQVARRRAAQTQREFHWAHLRLLVIQGWSSAVEYKKGVAEKGRLCRAGSGDSLDGRLLATAWRRWTRSFENIRELWREVETAITARFTGKRLAEVAAAWAGYVVKQKLSRETLRERAHLKPTRRALLAWLQLTRAVALSRTWEAIRASRLAGRCLTIWSDFYREQRRCLQHAYEVRQKQRMRHFERWYRATRATRVGERVELILKWSKLLRAFNWWKDLSSGRRNQRSLRCLFRLWKSLARGSSRLSQLAERIKTARQRSITRRALHAWANSSSTPSGHGSQRSIDPTALSAQYSEHAKRLVELVTDRVTLDWSEIQRSAPPSHRPPRRLSRSLDDWQRLAGHLGDAAAWELCGTSKLLRGFDERPLAEALKCTRENVLSRVTGALGVYPIPFLR